MRKTIIILTLFFSPLTALAQEDSPLEFLSGEVKIKWIPLTNEPDLIKKDYTDYEEVPWAEVGFKGRAKLFSEIDFNFYPYFRTSDENAICLIGLQAQAKYELFDNWLGIGYGHHSWHNADADTPNGRGRTQDWIFADFNFLDWEIGGLKTVFYLESRYLPHNTDPIEIKNVYHRDDPTALAEAALPIYSQWGRFDAQLRPYVLFSKEVNRYGISGEASFELTSFLSVFTEANYYTALGEDRYLIAVGISIKFK